MIEHLQVEGLSVAYSGPLALDGVSLEVRTGSVIAVLGANGAGKSTLLRALSGLTPVVSGKIRCDGRDITKWSPYRITRLGMSHVPEGRRVVAPLTVQENLMVSGESGGGAGRLQAQTGLEQAYSMFPRLRERRDQPSALLSGGEQQMLAIARAVMARPSVLLLDEPSLGLAPKVIDEIYELLRPGSSLREGRAIVLAEQSAALALDVAEVAYVLSKGRVVKSGSAADVLRSGVLDAYLG